MLGWPATLQADQDEFPFGEVLGRFEKQGSEPLAVPFAPSVLRPVYSLMGSIVSEIIGWLTWGAALAEVFRAIRTNSAPHDIRWRFAAIVAFAAFPWTSWTSPQEFSPDESLALSGALTLWSDPLFFRSVEGTTAGPLHVYMLMPAALGVGHHGYFFARLTGHVLLLGTLFLAGTIVRRLDRVAESVAVLAAVSAFAFTRSTDFQHASTELLPCFLVVLALWIHLRSPALRWGAPGIGFLLGLVPWSKLQVAPVALGVGVALVGLACRERRWRDVAGMVGAALLPTFLVAVIVASAGIWEDMVVPYLLANTIYPSATQYSTFSALRGFGAALIEDGQMGMLLALGGGLALTAHLLPRTVSRRATILTWAAWGWFAVSLFCVAAPRRPYLHYWYVLAAPLTVLIGLAVARLRAEPGPIARPASVRWSIAILAVLMLPLAAWRMAGPDRSGWIRSIFARFHRENQELSGLTRPFLRPADSMAIWGNRCGLYIELGLPQGTRQGHTAYQFLKSKAQGYFLRVYWEEFRRRQPAVFVDATGGDNLMSDLPNQPHENFAVLAEAIRRDYTLIGHRYGTRIYLRNGRLPAGWTTHPP